ncbi:MAG: response regulator, partial [Leptospira sp.]|nr:response regulator [Leptospira sp.]
MIKTNTVQKLPKVLIIDDDLTIVEIIQSILENSEFDIMTASDGDRGLEAIKEWQPDIVLCDLVMPTIDGYEVLVRLQNDPNQSNVPVVFMSSKNDYNSVRTGMRLGADDYLIKPFTPEELLSTVKSRLIRNRN